MTPAMVSGIVQPLPRISSPALSGSSQQLPKESSSTENTAAPKGNDPVSLDYISISQQARQAISPRTNEDPLKNNLNIETSVQENSANTSAATAKVQFVYDLKGDMVTKFKDSSERIIYQIPSELNVRLAELLSKSDSSVDTKV